MDAAARNVREKCASCAKDARKKNGRGCARARGCESPERSEKVRKGPDSGPKGMGT